MHCVSMQRATHILVPYLVLSNSIVQNMRPNVSLCNVRANQLVFGLRVHIESGFSVQANHQTKLDCHPCIQGLSNEKVLELRITQWVWVRVRESERRASVYEEAPGFCPGPRLGETRQCDIIMSNLFS